MTGLGRRLSSRRRMRHLDIIIPTILNIDSKTYPLVSGSSRYGPAGHDRFGGQTRKIAAKSWPWGFLAEAVEKVAEVKILETVT